MCLMADGPRARPTEGRGAARRRSRSTSARASPSARRRSRSARASACRAPRSATRWRPSRSSGSSSIRTRASGRIPTDAGYRHYVDALPVGGRLREQQRRAIAGYFAEAMLDLEEVLKGSVQLISRMTQYAGLAVPPSSSDEPIMRLELIDMGPTIMVLAVGQHGRVDKRIIDRPNEVDAKVLLAAEQRLAPLRGTTYSVAQVRLLQMAAEGPREEHELDPRTWPRRSAAPAARDRPHMVVGGVANLADEAQLWRRETVRRLFEALEREHEMLEVLKDVRVDDEQGVSVTIGGEHPATGEWEASLVTAAVQGRRRYGRHDRPGRPDADGLRHGDGLGARGREAAERAGHGAGPVAMATVGDLYEILGVGRDASQDEIRSAYRALARQHHPDVNADPASEQRFKEVSGAYEILSDPEKRQRYDTFGATGGPAGVAVRRHPGHLRHVLRCRRFRRRRRPATVARPALTRASRREPRYADPARPSRRRRSARAARSRIERLVACDGLPWATAPSPARRRARAGPAAGPARRSRSVEASSARS